MEYLGFGKLILWKLVHCQKSNTELWKLCFSWKVLILLNVHRVMLNKMAYIRRHLLIKELRKWESIKSRETSVLYAKASKVFFQLEVTFSRPKYKHKSVTRKKGKIFSEEPITQLASNLSKLLFIHILGIPLYYFRKLTILFRNCNILTDLVDDFHVQ